jgi:Amidohydrolase family
VPIIPLGRLMPSLTVLPTFLLTGLAALTASTRVDASSIAITDVNVISMSDGNIVQRQTVVIRDGWIRAIGPSARLKPPAGSRRIRADGKFLIPGLVDMHVHIGWYLPREFLKPDHQTLDMPAAPAEWKPVFENELLLYVSYGVTSVRAMAGTRTIQVLVQEINQGTILGPHIHSASPIIDGVPPSSPVSNAYLLIDPAEVPRVVDGFYDQGYRSLKVYNMLSAPVYNALVASAHAKGMTVVGHVPFAVGLEGAIAARQDTIEHLRGYDNDPSTPPVTSLSVDRFKVMSSIPDAMMRDRARATAAGRMAIASPSEAHPTRGLRDGSYR